MFYVTYVWVVLMEVSVGRSEIAGEASPPPSKSYTHRAFIAAALSPKAKVENPLIAEDTLSTLNFCKFIGAKVLRERNRKYDGDKCTKNDRIIFEGVSKINTSGFVYLGNSGTTTRIALGILSLSRSGRYSVLDGDESLRTRPNKQLAEVLRSLGAKIRSNDMFNVPIWVKGVLRGGDVSIQAESSQYISSLLFSLPLGIDHSELRVISTKSRPYIDITTHVLRESGIEFIEEWDGENEDVDLGKGTGTFLIPGGQNYSLSEFRVPSDFSSTSYLIAAGVLAGKLKIKNVFDSMQGDKVIIDLVKEMGGSIRWDKESGIISVERSELNGVEFDASNTPDLVPAIAAIAAVAKGKTRIYNAEHLRLKEIDRIEGSYRNLKSLGIESEKKEDGIIIKGGIVEGGVVDSFGDHRMALAFSLLGLVSEREVVVKNAECVSVSFPEYFELLSSLGARIKKGNGI